MSVISTVGIINMMKDGKRTGCFDVCRSDTAVHLRINRLGSEVVITIPFDTARELSELIAEAAQAEGGGE